MRVVGFSFSKISAERTGNVDRVPNETLLEITEVKKEENEFLKDQVAVRFTFNYEVSLKKEKKSKEKPLASYALAGDILTAVSEEEAKEILTAWKTKKVPATYRTPLMNFVLRRATPKVVDLCDTIGLPSPVPIPQVKLKEE